jgi:serine/threonine protein kinase
MAIEVGTRAGKYELLQQLGAGGFGLVFLARDHELGRDCALKFLLPEHTGNAEHVQRFLQEARAAARIHHPGIVTVFECGQLPRTGSGVDGLVYIAMELLRGESLAARLAGGALPVAEAVTIARQIASAVGAAHQIGIVHRDLKPENVYLVPDPETVSGERVKVLDFGIAKLGEASTVQAVHTAPYLIFGSPRYMSPEQCRSTARVDARSDIYSLGVMLFEMLCGERPFVDTDLGALIAKHQVVEPPRLRAVAPGLPADLDELVASMLAKSPDARPQSMEAVQRALQPSRASTAPAAPRRAASAPSPAEPAAIVATERVLTNPSLSPVTPAAGSPMVTPLPPSGRARAGTPSPAPAPEAPEPRAPRTHARVRARRWAVGGGLAVVAVVAIAVIATRSSGARHEPRAAAASGLPRDRLPTPRELREHHRVTIARRDAATLGAELAPSVFAMGPDATELAYGATAARALIAEHIDQIQVGPRDAPIGQAGDVAWWIEIDSARQFATSTIAVASGREWRVAAWKLSRLVENETARKLAAAGKLPLPLDPGPGAGEPSSAAEIAARLAFEQALSSRAAFIAAFSTRDDALVSGTAPLELSIGGNRARAVLATWGSPRPRPGEVAIGRLTDHAVWAAANIDFTMAARSAKQIYRLLALLLKEDGRWTIAMAHFSNAGPIGRP